MAAVLSRSTVLCGEVAGSSMWHRALSPSERGAGGIEDGDLLPDLAAQVGGQLLDVVDRVDHHSVGQVLRVERGELIGEGQHFAAIVEIARQLEAAHRTLRGSAGRCAAAQNSYWAPPELMPSD